MGGLPSGVAVRKVLADSEGFIEEFKSFLFFILIKAVLGEADLRSRPLPEFSVPDRKTRNSENSGVKGWVIYPNIVVGA